MTDGAQEKRARFWEWLRKHVERRSGVNIDEGAVLRVPEDASKVEVCEKDADGTLTVKETIPIPPGSQGRVLKLAKGEAEVPE